MSAMSAELTDVARQSTSAFDLHRTSNVPHMRHARHARVAVSYMKRETDDCDDL
jgi:hypothetical protein